MPKQAANKTTSKPGKKAAAKTAPLNPSPARSASVKAPSAKAAKAASKNLPSQQSTPPPTHQEIAERAHHLWQQHGAHHGAHVEHWFQAEQQLRNK